MVKCRRKEGGGGDGLGKVCSHRPIRARNLQMCAWRVRKNLEGGLERLPVLGGVRNGGIVAAAGEADRGFWVGLCMLYVRRMRGGGCQ